MGLEWIDSSWLANLVRDWAWTWPSLETLHFMGLTLLIGALAVIDLRVLGMAKRIPLAAIEKLTPVAYFGFTVNLITGIMFFFGDPYRYYPNIAFRIKMILLVIAGINLLIYKIKVEPALLRGDYDDNASALAKAVALTSIVAWVGVLAGGRLIPYFEY